jgi:hypothetical protein
MPTAAAISQRPIKYIIFLEIPHRSKFRTISACPVIFVMPAIRNARESSTAIIQASIFLVFIINTVFGFQTQYWAEPGRIALI